MIVQKFPIETVIVKEDGTVYLRSDGLVIDLLHKEAEKVLAVEDAIQINERIEDQMED